MEDTNFILIQSMKNSFERPIKSLVVNEFLKSAMKLISISHL